MAPAPGRPVPHMGWSKLDDVAPGIGLTDGDYRLFRAQLRLRRQPPATAARADYGGQRDPGRDPRTATVGRAIPPRALVEPPAQLSCNAFLAS